jgi:23S rRNA pseudouridine2605 synthase
MPKQPNRQGDVEAAHEGSPAADAAPMDSPPEGIRLQRVLAQAGLGSRRSCEELIAAGRVTVDGQVVTGQGMRVDPRRTVIRVDGDRVVTDERMQYLLVHKPLGVVSTMHDPQGRPSLGDLVADRDGRLFHVGRLDADTEGLLLLTNDGELAHRLSHPSFAVPKTYLAEVTGPLPKDLGRRLRSGLELDDGLARVDGFRVLTSAGNRVLTEVVVHEGRNRLVRRLYAAAGHPVLRLVRTAVGPLRLGDLRAGRVRPAGDAEVRALYRAVSL